MHSPLNSIKHPYNIRSSFPLLIAFAMAFATMVSVMFGVREIGLLALMASAGGVVAFISLITHPLVPFSLYFTCLFFSETSIPGIPITPNQALGILFFIAWGVWFVRGKTIALSPGVCVFLSLCGMYFAFSAITGEDELRGFAHFKAVLIYLCMAFTLGSTLRTEKSIRALAWIITICTAGAALHGIYQAFDKAIFSSFSGKWSDAVRVSGAAKNSIVYGWNLLYAFPFAFFLYTRHRSGTLKWLALGLGLFSVVTALLTFNRQTFLLVGFMVFLSVTLFSYPNRKRLILFVSVAGAIAVAAVLPMIVARMNTMGNLKTDASYLERHDQVLVALEMYRSAPLTGIGLGSYPTAWKQYIPADYSTYNMQYDNKSERYPDFGYLQLLAETGIVGLALACVMIVCVITIGWRMRRLALRHGDEFAANLATIVLVLGLYWALTNLVQDTFLYVRTWMLLGLTAVLTPRNLALNKESTQQ